MATESNIPTKIPVSQGSVPSDQLAKSNSQNSHTPGSGVKGFSGGVIPGKI